jgi:hypothetical protein
MAQEPGDLRHRDGLLEGGNGVKLRKPVCIGTGPDDDWNVRNRRVVPLSATERPGDVQAELR